MSKIAEKRTDEIVGEYHDGDYTDHSRHNTRWCSFREGYDQAMQDFMEWLKDCSTFTYSNGYKRIDDDLYNKLVEDFKNYMKNEI